MASRRRRRAAAPREPREGGGRTRSDFGARVLAAIPAVAFAIFIVYRGGLVFALGILALGIVCLGELFTMLQATHPVRLAGFIGLVGPGRWPRSTATSSRCCWRRWRWFPSCSG